MQKLLVQPSIENSKGLFADKRSRRVEVTAEFTPEDIVDIKNTDPEIVPKIAKLTTCVKALSIL